MEKDVYDAYVKAGRISNECLQYGKSLMKVGVPLVVVCDKVEEKILAMGGKIAFPAQISLNQVAAHYCPTDNDPLAFKEGDIAKIDIGVHINGFIADTALTVDFGGHEDLVRASQEALNAALKTMAVGVRLRDVGKAIQETISSYGFSPIRNLSGHGLDAFTVHTQPTVPNFDTGDNTEIEEDWVLACEPFATTGKGSIFESSNATVFGMVKMKSIRGQFARDLLKDIETYEGLPFTTRWLSRKHGVGKTQFGMKELINNGIIREYPPLPEVTGGLVSQHEHSTLFHEGKKLTYTRPD
jgi:methionyl aminopeptidase